MTETKRDEHERLQKRTDELKEDHAALDRELTPFNQPDHDEHSANLRKHQGDLAAHKRRQHERP
jgi:hypothetical protein